MKNVIKKILKEESNNRISREGYLNKVVEYLVDDTIFDYSDKRLLRSKQIKFPFLYKPTLPPHSQYIDLLSNHDHIRQSTYGNSSHYYFSKYCKYMYGLSDDEIDYVRKEYTNIISGKMNNKGNINESTGKMSREDYVDKILDYLVEDTTIDFSENEIYFPSFPLVTQSPFPRSTPISMIPPLSYLIIPFSEYCKYNYDLTDEEIDYLLEKYLEIISVKINEGFPDGLW